MRITKVKILKTNNDGLEDVNMDKLGQIVLIAGKNGSGKTRVLHRIATSLSSKLTARRVKKIESSLNTERLNLQNNNAQLVAAEVNLRHMLDGEDRAALESRINSYKLAIKSLEQNIKNLEEQLTKNEIETSEIAEDYAPIYFVPKNLSLKDCHEFPKDKILSAANQINNVGIDYLAEGALAKIQVIQDRWFSATHPQLTVTDAEKKIALDDYNKLTEFIKLFLNTSIGRTLDGEATLFNFPMGKANLSNGQKVLLQFCMAIYSQETSLRDLILILDEPENHLHPSVIIETLDRIQKSNSNGQIWIATHSIPLLAHFDPSVIWYVENNKISHAGKIPEKVLSSLLGNENEIAKLQDFVSLPAQYATSRYAFECLFEPSAVMTGSDDPQSSQIKAELLKLSGDDKLRVLDYGVGQGRLISNIFDLDQKEYTNLLKKIDYVGYDKFDTYKEICKNSIKKVFGSESNRYFNDVSQLLSTYDKNSFSIVIMCNVLHEIDPKEWLKLFSSEGVIANLLNDKGYLLLVEDHQMPIGEMAYQKGFLVLDTPQLKDLFKITEQEKDFTYNDKRSDGRLKAHLIPKRCLIRIDADSRIKALKSLSTTARENILRIREKEQSYPNGKLHGFWTQQFANAQLNIAELTTN